MKSEFTYKNFRFVPDGEVVYCGHRGRFWARYEYRNSIWVFCSKTFHRIRATKKEIVEGL